MIQEDVQADVQQGTLPDITGLPTHSPKRNKGIDHRKTVELARKGISHSDIAEIQGCSRANITQVLLRYGVVEQDTESYKDHRADILAGMQSKLLSSITDAEIKKAPVGSRILAVAQLYDKERLERSLSTSNLAFTLDTGVRRPDLDDATDVTPSASLDTTREGE